MIKGKNAVKRARAALGTPYGTGKGQLDCIGLVTRVIRTAPGGIPGYRTAGTASLWQSGEASGRYRHLTHRQRGTAGALAGQLAFKGRETGAGQPHHVGICTGEGTVVHASSALGRVAETRLDASWTLLATHRYIVPEG